MKTDGQENKTLHIVSGGNPENSDRVSQNMIEINSCGYNSVYSTVFHINRPLGRSDFQLIYIETGEGRFVLHEQTQILPVGTLILYKPGEPQIYSYASSQKVKTFWIHFTGTQIETILKQNGLWDNSVLFIGMEKAVPDLVMKIAREIQLKQFNFMQMATSYFLELITIIARIVHNQLIPSNNQFEILIPVVELLQREYYHTFSVEDLAARCSMSPSHFIRRFKEYTGVSPHHYQTNIRLEKAKLLLLDTTSTVSEIAFAVGYDNALYFSRLFRKYNGMSPTEFKNLNDLNFGESFS